MQTDQVILLTPTLLQATPTYVVALCLFLLIIVFFAGGYYPHQNAIRKNPVLKKVELGAINGTLLGLLGLLLAFTFSMASSRFDQRRQFIVAEANNIGTVILRADVYPDSIRNLLRKYLKQYVDERIAFYKAGTNAERAGEHFDKASALGMQVWSLVASYAKKDNITTRTSEIIPALNDMIDITTTRKAASESMIPDLVMYLLFVLCLCSAFLLGYDFKYGVDWVIVTGFALMLSVTVYTIIDLDRPRSGLITMDGANQNIVELLNMFSEN